MNHEVDCCEPYPERSSAYDPEVPFSLEQMNHNTPSWKHAIFVVHGIGVHDPGATAVGLRNGFEDAVEELRKTSGRAWTEMPATYLKEGYWGNFGNFESNFRGLWNNMNKASREYFEQIWKRRSESYTRTAFWYAMQSARLPLDALLYWQDVPKGFFRRLREFAYRLIVRIPLYLLVIFVSWTMLLAFLLWPRGRRILSTVMGDVRLYVAPRGPVEQAIRQRIDCKVRDLFLQMLGLDEDLQQLPELAAGAEDPEGKACLKIGGRTNQFERITWVAHSLGTVVSYSVIGELLCKCRDLREQARADGKEVPEGVLRVENGLYRFYTMGSPLRKIFWLFPNVLRCWPIDYFESHILKNDTKNITLESPWWINFRHIWDPVSGYVTGSKYFRWAVDCHSPQVFTVPGVAHVGYWHTVPIIKYILAQGRTDLPGASEVRLPKWPQFAIFKILWHLSFLFILGIVCALIFHGIGTAMAPVLTRVEPLWSFLLTVPIIGPVLHLLSCLTAKLYCWLLILAGDLLRVLNLASAYLWSWLSKLCPA